MHTFSLRRRSIHLIIHIYTTRLIHTHITRLLITLFNIHINVRDGAGSFCALILVLTLILEKHRLLLLELDAFQHTVGGLTKGEEEVL